MEEAGVQNVTVKTVTFTGTENGLRVKTWARPSNGFVRGVLFQHAVMVNVQNPIIIDQQYCPNDNNCPNQVCDRILLHFLPHFVPFSFLIFHRYLYFLTNLFDQIRTTIFVSY